MISKVKGKTEISPSARKFLLVAF